MRFDAHVNESVRHRHIRAEFYADAFFNRPDLSAWSSVNGHCDYAVNSSGDTGGIPNRRTEAAQITFPMSVAAIQDVECGSLLPLWNSEASFREEKRRQACALQMRYCAFSRAYRCRPGHRPLIRNPAVERNSFSCCIEDSLKATPEGVALHIGIVSWSVGVGWCSILGFPLAFEGSRNHGVRNPDFLIHNSLFLPSQCGSIPERPKFRDRKPPVVGFDSNHDSFEQWCYAGRLDRTN